MTDFSEIAYKKYFLKKYKTNVNIINLQDLAHKEFLLSGFTSSFSFIPDHLNYYQNAAIGAQGFIGNSSLYLLLEDANDGYRSALELILKISKITPEIQALPGFHLTEFSPIKVKAIWTCDQSREDKILENEKRLNKDWNREKEDPSSMLALKELESGKKITALTFGTNSADDYYPSFEFNTNIVKLQEALILAAKKKLNKITEASQARPKKMKML